jgi:hypothetical protein
MRQISVVFVFSENERHQENVIYYGTLQTTTEHYVVLCSKIRPTDEWEQDETWDPRTACFAGPILSEVVSFPRARINNFQIMRFITTKLGGQDSELHNLNNQCNSMDL